MGDMEALVAENDKRLSVHEAICAERYEGIQESFRKGTKRMQKIEYLLYFIAVAVLLGPEFTAQLVKQFIK